MTVPSRRSRASRGFSLAEVLVALALLSVIILALFGLVTAGVQRAYGGKKMTEGLVLAQSIMERINVEAPHLLIGATGAQETKTQEWNVVSGVPVEAALVGANVDERNRWRTMLAQSQLPGYAGSPAQLIVKMTATPTTPTARTFDTAAAVRIEVDVTWYEYGKRKRTVHLETMNVRSANL